MTTAPRPTASIESAYAPGIGRNITVWFDYPADLVDRPRSHGISTGTDRRLAERLAKAIDAGAVAVDREILTDIHGQTYVGHRSLVSGRHLAADLARLGF